MPANPLDALLRPRAIALIGASSTAGSVGQVLLSNLLGGGFEGRIFAVNPRPIEAGRAIWLATPGELPEGTDLAIVATPAAAVPAVVRALGEAGTRVAVIVTAGLTAENGLREAMLEAARPFPLRLVGPNCLGVMMPHLGINAAFARSGATPGRLALISQSGALVTGMLDWAQARNLGFSGIVSGGDMADVELADLITLFAADPDTGAIALYIEGVGDGAGFVAAAQAASRLKPLVAIKAGRNPAAGNAVRSHTGALMGAAEVYEAAFRRAGIVQVRSLLDLFDAAEALCLAPPMRGDGIAIVGNGGGSAILAVDAMPAGKSRLAMLSGETLAALDAVLPPIWSHANPVDLIGDATPARYGAALQAVLQDPEVDGVLVLHCPTAVADGVEVAKAVAETVAQNGKGRPVLACWLGESNGRNAGPVLAAAGIPAFESPEDAVEGFDYLLSRRAVPIGHAASRPSSSRGAAACRHIIEKCRAEGREWLDEIEAKRLLDAYGIRTAPTRFARTPDRIRAATSDIPPPYAVKIVSPDILHKSDAGGVSLGLPSAHAAAAAAREMLSRIREALPEARLRGFAIETMIAPTHAHELILGLKRDPAFGAVVIVGAGGTAVEILNDKAVELAPVDPALAREMVGRTRIAKLMAGYRGEPAADLESVCRAIASVSEIAADLPEILELDINPLLADPKGVWALDARIRLRTSPEG